LIDVFKKILTELVDDAVMVESDGDVAGYYWEINMTDEKMENIVRKLNSDD
tara:strand:- start:1844 stop:1996 length:153 start_codon:yes stop_codon:yes gene_type:complete